MYKNTLTVLMPLESPLELPRETSEVPRLGRTIDPVLIPAAVNVFVLGGGFYIAVLCFILSLGCCRRENGLP